MPVESVSEESPSLIVPLSEDEGRAEAKPKKTGSREWYTDQHMVWLLKHYCDDIDICAPIHDEANQGELNAQSLWENIDHEGASGKMIAAVNLGNTHWVALYIDYSRKPVSVYYADPFGNTKISTRLKTAIENIARIKVWGGITWRNNTTRYQAAMDGHNCGPWTVVFLKSLTENGSLPRLGDINIVNTRAAHNQLFV